MSPDKHGLEPNEYRQKWALARDNPMAAPNYAERRSALAKSIGLGRKRSEAARSAKGRGKRIAKAKSEAPAGLADDFIAISERHTVAETAEEQHRAIGYIAIHRLGKGDDLAQPNSSLLSQPFVARP